MKKNIWRRGIILFMIMSLLSFSLVWAEPGDGMNADAGLDGTVTWDAEALPDTGEDEDTVDPDEVQNNIEGEEAEPDSEKNGYVANTDNFENKDFK